jgi:peptide/nickel transport system permease protein
MARSLRELKRKPLAMVAACIILLCALCAVFAYWLAPDDSPDANVMVLELASRSAGFSKDFMLIPKTVKQAEISFFRRTISGTPMNYTLVPINHWGQNGTQFWAEHYIDEGLQDTLRIDLQKNGLPIIKHKTFYLGTDTYGRDILSRLLIGARVSMAVGLISVILSLGIAFFLAVWPVILVV